MFRRIKDTLSSNKRTIPETQDNINRRRTKNAEKNRNSSHIYLSDN
jgi:hypothetical protein